MNLASLPTRNLTIRVNMPTGFAGSVKFVYGSTQWIEGLAPYLIAGDNAAGFNKWNPGLGLFTLTVTAYSGKGGTGKASTPVTIQINVQDVAPAPPPNTQPVSRTAKPVESNEVLYNPGMGFADFHHGWGKPTQLAQYPTPRVAYFRWTWAELEPTDGQINYKMIDDAIAKAVTKGQTLAFRIMPSIPGWVSALGVAQLGSGTSTVPDHNNPVFLSLHERLVRAIALRYGSAATIDHVDIGSVGCWGEWNDSCCPAGKGTTCANYMPNQNNRRAIVNWYYSNFPTKPLVALAAGTGYANTVGAGWRGDCFGDLGMFGSTWSHMLNWYPSIARMPEVVNAWQTAPVQFEACGIMQDWYNRGFNIDTILQRGLDWHISVFNGKNSPVPAAWRPKIDEWLKKIGYRFVLKELTHKSTVARNAQLVLSASWLNKGVAPAYQPWPVAYRLRSSAGAIVAQWRSAADVRRWLPGTHAVQDTVQVSQAVAPGSYWLDVAILNEDATAGHVEIAIAGKRSDLWYQVSSLTVQ